MNNTQVSFCGKRSIEHKKHLLYGFTLAEMMVVMLIMSIILAAMAPVMTTRARKMEEDRINSTIWRYADNGLDIYYGANLVDDNEAKSQTAMIGQQDANVNARLIINTNAAYLPYAIAFNKEGNNLGHLYLDDSTLVLGNGSKSSSYSTAVGIGALATNTGDENTALGYNTLKGIASGTKNTAMGAHALESAAGNTSENTAVGYKALQSVYGATRNTGVGAYALEKLENGVASDNTAIGYKALAVCTVAGNTAIGSKALSNNTSGFSNIAVGNNALQQQTSGSYNVSIGSSSSLNNNGDYNTAIGHIALYSATDADYNTAVGSSALPSFNGTGTGGNTAIGAFSMNLLSSGTNNTAIGYNAMNANSGSSSSSNNIAIGTNVLTGTNLSNNIAIGNDALSEASSSNNIAIGHSSLKKATGSYNLVVGSNSANNLTSGTYNIALGMGGTNNSPLYSLSTGSYNVGIGFNALNALSSGSQNTAVGYGACNNVTGSNKTCLGRGSHPNTTYAGDDVERIFIGGQSEYNSGSSVLEVHNDSGKATMLSKNVAKSAVVINGMLIVKGGIIANIPEVSGTTISTSTNPSFLAYDAENKAVTAMDVSGSSYVSSFSGVFKNPGSGTASDRRLKYVGQENKSGLDKIRQLKVFNYTYKKDPKKEPHVGVIAQDLQKIFPDAVKKGVDGFLTIRMEDMFYAVINAIKELDAKVTAQDKKIKELEARIEKLEAKIKYIHS